MIKNGNSARAMEAGTNADVVIRAQISGLKATDFQDRHMAVPEGEKAAAAVLPQIKAKLAQLRESR
jgi:NTE family protein